MTINSYLNWFGIYTAIQPIDSHGYPQVKACDFRWPDRVQPEEGKWFDSSTQGDLQIGSAAGLELWIEWRGWHVEGDDTDAPVTGFLRSICHNREKPTIVGAIIHVAQEKRLIGASIACFVPNAEVSSAIASACGLGLPPNSELLWITHNPLPGEDKMILKVFSESAFCAYVDAVSTDGGIKTLHTLFSGH